MPKIRQKINYFEVVPLVNIAWGVKQSYTYACAERLPFGTLVRIPFGRIFCDGITVSAPKRKTSVKFRIKSVTEIHYAGLLGKKELAAARSISTLYQAPLGNTLKLFVPNISKLSGSKKLVAVSEAQSMSIDDPKEINWQTGQTLKNVPVERQKIKIPHKKNFFYVAPSAKSITSLMYWIIDSWTKSKKPGQLVVIFPNLADAVFWQEELEAQAMRKIFLFASQISFREKHSLFSRISENEKIIIFGTKGLLFSPRLKPHTLIIMNEEDAAYKQKEKEPRYHALACAKIIAKAHGARFGIVSVAPRPETFFESHEAAETEVIGQTHDPAVNLIFEQAASRDQRKPRLISSLLKTKIAEKISGHEKVLIVIDKSGTATKIICASCGAVAKCAKCGRILGYSELDATQFCQKCGIISDVFPACNECGHFYFNYRGRGAETVGKQLQKDFPAAKICEVSEKKLQKSADIVEHRRNIEKAEIVISPMALLKYLVGLKFEFVAGLPRALWKYQIPDWNAESRRFETLRILLSLLGSFKAKNAGEIYVPVPAKEIDFRRRQHDFSFDRYMENELKYRKRFRFPPFGRLVKLIYSNKKRPIAEKEIVNIIDFIEKQLDNKAMPIGFHEPLVETAKNRHAMIMGLLLERDVSNEALREARLALSGKFSGKWSWESDPQSLIFT